METLPNQRLRQVPRPLESEKTMQAVTYADQMPPSGNIIPSDKPEKRLSARRGAFTLIELLVVIAIIAILAARRVAQIFNLLYRGFAIRLAAGFSKLRRDLRALCRMQFGDTADGKSALRGTGG